MYAWVLRTTSSFKDGQTAPDNAALVKQAAEAAASLGRPLAGALEIRKRFGAT